MIGEDEIAAVTDAIKSGWVSSMGPYISQFEEDFARYIGVDFAVAVSNGTAALHLALHALGIGHGDEVLVPDLTFVATAHAVLMTGATPVLVDVEPDTWCLDPRAVERAITRDTKAIIPVHLYGHPANMEELGRIASSISVPLIEDAAEAHGATAFGVRVGALGKAGTFSFYGNKTITTGEGGAVVTNDGDLAKRLRFLRDHGMSAERRYYHSELSFNYRLTNLQAAVGVAQLKRIASFLDRKRRVFGWYREVLGSEERIRLNAEREGYRNSYWMTSLVAESPELRTTIIESLAELGIDTRPFFVAMSDLPHLKHCKTIGAHTDTCEVSAFLSRTGMNLPSGCDLDEDTVKMIGRSIGVMLARS